MGELTPIALSRRSNVGRHRVESAARLINCYAESLGDEAKSQFAVYAVNGWESYTTLTGASGGVRGMLALESELLTVAGRQLYATAQDGTTTLIGGIASDGLVTMQRNRQAPHPQVVIVSDGQWYIYQNGAVEIGSDPDLPAPIYSLQSNGYFIFLHSDGRWTISGLDDVTIDGLDSATAASDADGLVAGAKRGSDVVLFGSRSSEFWSETGAADFPFERQAARNFGCYAAGSVSEITALLGGQMLDSVIWAGTDEKGAYTGLFLLNGYGANKISTTDIDRLILDEDDPDALRSFAWSEDGHVFYTITGTTFSRTYDTVESLWHERKSNAAAFWKVSAHATFDRKTIFGSSDTGTLYRSGRDLYDAGGEAVVMEIHLPIVHAFPYDVIVNRFAVDAVTGVGLNSTDAHLLDPKITLDISHDGGANFGTESSRSLGRMGQINQRLDWWSLGMISRIGAVFRLRISAGVKRCVLGAAIDADKLAA